jgi:hypothetical protein
VHLVQVSGHADAGRLQPWQHADDERRKHGESQGDEHGTRRQPKGDPVRHELARLVHRLDHLERVASSRQPGGRAEQRERERLDEQLRENPPAARAERAAHGKLAQAGHRARVDENGEIDRDQHGERTREQLTNAQRPHHGWIAQLRVRRDAGSKGQSAFRTCRCRLLRHGGELRVRLLDRDAGRETPENLERGSLPGRVLEGVHAQRDPELVPAREFEAFRHDANDGPRNAAEAHRSTDDVGVPREMQLPRLVADDDDR